MVPYILLLVVVVAIATVLLVTHYASQPTSLSGTSSQSPPSSAYVEGSSQAEENPTSGWFLSEGKAYYKGRDGSLYTGSHVIDRAECLFLEDGSLSDGWALIGSVRYHFSQGVLSKGTQVIDGITCFINDDGTMFVGWYDDEKTGTTHYYDFHTGASYRGWKDIDGKRYYFYEDGSLARSTTVDGITIGADGVAADSGGESSTPKQPVRPSINLTEELAGKLDQILDQYGRSPQNIYDYVHDHYTYKWAEEKSVEENALHILKYGTGSCYNFASLTYLLFDRAGYDVYYVTGKGWQRGDYHCWILANFDGGWYYVDSLYVRSGKLTADELTEKGYKWDKDAYPS